MAITVGRPLTLREETALAIIVAASNTARAAMTPALPAETPAEYFDRVCITRVLKDYILQIASSQAAPVAEALPNATPMQIAAMKATLGII